MLKRTKRAIVLASVIPAIFGLVSCGNGTSEDSDNAASPENSITIIDEAGEEITLSQPAESAFVLNWYGAEVLRAIGAGDKIVAIDDSADPEKKESNVEYFSSLSDATVVGDYRDPNWEAVVESGADVAVIMRNGPYEEAKANLEPFGIQVIQFTGWDPKVIREFAPALGEVFGTEEGAADLVAFYDEIDQLLSERTAGVEKKSVYYENNGDYLTGVPGSGWHDIIVAAGGENLYGDVTGLDNAGASVHEFEVDPVDIIQRNPDLIVRQGIEGLVGGYQTWSDDDAQRQAQTIVNRPGWSGITAVENGDVVVVDNFLLSALGKQLGALAIATWLYPEQFEDIDLNDYFDRWQELQGVEPRDADDYFNFIEGES